VILCLHGLYHRWDHSMKEVYFVGSINNCEVVNVMQGTLSNLLLEHSKKFWQEHFDTGIKNRGKAKENCWWGAKPQFSDKQTLLELNLVTNRTSLEFYQQYNVDKHYWYSANVPTSSIFANVWHHPSSLWLCPWSGKSSERSSNGAKKLLKNLYNLPGI